MYEKLLNKVEIERITNSKSASAGGRMQAAPLSGRDKNYSAGLKESLHFTVQIFCCYVFPHYIKLSFLPYKRNNFHRALTF